MNRSDKLACDADPFAFLAGGGEMGSLIRSMDWSGTSLGPVAGWPQSLRTTISICLASDLPICVIWGPGLVQLYNDAYRVLCGDKHPRSMGQNFPECWKEAWPVIGVAHDAAWAGDKAILETQPIFLERHGFLEECFFTFSFSPIRDETGRVGGLFHPVIETTAQMFAQRGTRALRDLTDQTSKAKSVTDVLALSAQTPAEYALDLPVQNDPLVPAAPPQRPADARPLVLVADDNVDMRRYIVDLLGEHYRTEAVPDGEAALAAALAQTPDLILANLVMPRLDGHGLLQALRADPATRGVPVILLAACTGDKSRIEGLQAGADDCLVKPFSARELLACVAVHLRMARMRREASEALRAGEAHHRLLFELTADGIVLADATGRYVDVNAAACKMLGYSREEVLARTIPDMLEPDEWSRIAPEIARCADGQTLRSEWRFRRKDGSVFVGEITGSQLAEGRVQGILRDITERRAVEAAHRASEAQIRSILESITDGFFALDRDWCITYINTAGERFLNRTPGDLIGKSLWKEFSGTVGSEFERVYRRVVAGQKAESFTAYYPNFERWYEVNAYPATDGLTAYFRDVTDRRRVDQERQQFAALIDASPDFIGVAGLDQRGVYVNRAGMALTGLKPDQLANISVLDFFPESERDRILAVINRSEAGKDVFVDTYFQHLQTGQLIPVSWSFLKLRDAGGNVNGYATVTRDLTERIKAEDLLRASEERRRLALDAAELGMWYVDPATRATKTDARYRAIFGTTEEWTDYLQAVAVIHPDDQPAVLKAVAAATRLEDPTPYAMEYRIVHPDGSLRWVYARGRSTIVGAGPTRRVASFDGTVADITDRKRTEEEREQLVARLRAQDQRKNEFLATLAHELRNPLAPIRNGLQWMKLAGNDSAAVEQARAMMERQVGHMVRLIDDLLDLSRISQGQLQLRRERVELAVVMRNAVETSQPLIEQMGHALSLVMPTVPIYLDGDMTRLAQVISNLLNNAAKYTERGGSIRLCAEQLGSEIVVIVEDNGVGIPAHMLSDIFDIFTQVDRSLELSKGGLGIGLSLVQRLVEMHGGSVQARSEGPGRGSAFIVRLPVALSLAGDRPGEGEVQPAGVPLRRRILVVDDNRDAADSLAALLTIMGNETKTAYDGLEALEQAAAFRPDVTLLDIGMPQLNGYEVCRRLRQQAWGKNMVLLALTGWGQEADQQRSLAAGFDAHLVKPVLPAALEALLNGVTGAKA